MKLSFYIDHPSLAILLGSAQNSKSFADNAWGRSSFEDVCERFYVEFTKKKEINIDLIEKILEDFRIEKKNTFDNFALDYISENLKSSANPLMN